MKSTFSQGIGFQVTQSALWMTPQTNFQSLNGLKRALRALNDDSNQLRVLNDASKSSQITEWLLKWLKQALRAPAWHLKRLKITPSETCIIITPQTGSEKKSPQTNSHNNYRVPEWRLKRLPSASPQRQWLEHLSSASMNSQIGIEMEASGTRTEIKDIRNDVSDMALILLCLEREIVSLSTSYLLKLLHAR